MIEFIRNFAVVSHVDHGKSTLADRFLEVTGTVPKEKMRQQYLDMLSLEREKGITIKMQPVRMHDISRTETDLTRTVTDRDQPRTGSSGGLLYEDLTYKIRNALFLVRGELGLGHKEAVYQNAIEIALRNLGLTFEKEKGIDVLYGGERVGLYRPDFMIEGKVILEVKTLPLLTRREERQLWYYLKGTSYRLALLANFGPTELDVRRVVYDAARDGQPSLPRLSASIPPQSAYILNLIDTPGHVDFTYEVSRALTAVEGAILLVDATQGIQAQTLANFEIARQLNLAIIPALNKIDLRPSNIEELRLTLGELTNVPPDAVYLVSAKTGEGVEELLRAVIEKVPPPAKKEVGRMGVTPYSHPDGSVLPLEFQRAGVPAPFQALVFDSHFDPYKGVIAHVRVFQGNVRRDDGVSFLAQQQKCNVVEVGYFSPLLSPSATLEEGEIGYIATGMKDPGIIRIGDTVTHTANPAAALPGYQDPRPVIFASVFPAEADQYTALKDNLVKLRLNDPAIQTEPFTSPVFGRGFQLGFLGLLHLEIVKERLYREFSTEVVLTLPSIAYRIIPRTHADRTRTGADAFRATSASNQQKSASKGPLGSASSPPQSAYQEIKNPQELPDESKIGEILEPWIRVEVVSPLSCVSALMDALKARRSVFLRQEHLGSFVITHYLLPLEELIAGLYDEVKNISSGYASLRWEFDSFKEGDLVRLDIFIAEEKESSLSRIVPRERAESTGRKIVQSLKESLPRENFAVKLQAALGSKIIARETIPALRRDVTGHLYGGDRTRKVKLWKKQQRGKKKLQQLGRGKVAVPTEVLMKLLKI